MSQDEGAARISLDVRASDYVLLDQIAAYRNALARAQNKKLRKQWTRKSMAESMLAIQCDALRVQLAEMKEALGSLPDGKDDTAMEKYARRVLAWDKKQSK